MSTPRRLALISILSAGLLGLSGCDLLGPSGGDPRLELDASSYVPGDTIRIRLINAALYEVPYYPCFPHQSMERRVGDGWEQVYRSGCQAIYTAVPPGDTLRRSVVVADTFARPGAYRYDFELRIGGLDEPPLGYRWVPVEAYFEVREP